MKILIVILYLILILGEIYTRYQDRKIEKMIDELDRKQAKEFQKFEEEVVSEIRKKKLK